MSTIAFIDLEADPNRRVAIDYGIITDGEQSYHGRSLSDFLAIARTARFICGHNILLHDLEFVGRNLRDLGVDLDLVIDTLFWSPLLFPAKPYHALLKDDKLQIDELNNPLNDAKKARDLFYDEVAAFRLLDARMQQVLYSLLSDKWGFNGFFCYLGCVPAVADAEELVRGCFQGKICENADLRAIVNDHSVELAYTLSLIHVDNRYSITPPWVLHRYPKVEQLMMVLRNVQCLQGCAYCQSRLDPHRALRRFFGYEKFREFDGKRLQEEAVEAAIRHQSLLTVFPTGGGKSITFQLPALMSGEAAKALTVVISPLQSLMKDQVDNLERLNITDAVTINGLLDPVERAKAFERVEDGSASLLYISPESLRSRSVESLLLGRNIARFVIDEAHCFSSWGQDFRVDYLYIGEFIKALQEKKGLGDKIPVSCFTATAKQQVIEDILNYFQDKLGLELKLFTASARRRNLHFKVFEKKADDEKYQALRNLISEKDCPTIVYVSRTRKAELLSERLTRDGLKALCFHGKKPVEQKVANQDAFMRGEANIMVATSAFGMGVDKKDVGLVVHYEISDSLENYVQEAGRAGRDESIEAKCFVLFSEDDLDKHLVLLNQTKMSGKEIGQIWRAIKDVTRLRSSVSNSALEIARRAGWDDTVSDIETRVTTAIAALEDAGYVRRGQNMPRIFANSIRTKTAQEAIDRIDASNLFVDREKVMARRIIKKLFSSKRKSEANEETAESRVDYISDHLGIVKEEVIHVIQLMREEGILADAKDLTAFILSNENRNRSLQVVETYHRLESLLLKHLEEREKTWNIKEMNEVAEREGIKDSTPLRLKTILNIWAIKHWVRRSTEEHAHSHVRVLALQHPDKLRNLLNKRHELAKFIVEYLFERAQHLGRPGVSNEQVLVEFSVLELQQAFCNAIHLSGQVATSAEVEDALFYLQRIEAIKIDGGFLVVYNRLTINRLELNNQKQYTKEDYKKLQHYYEQKVQQIHIVGEYAKRMMQDYTDALQFVDDYFQLNYPVFLRKYFPGSKADFLKLKVTPQKFQRLFGELSPSQLKIVNDVESQRMVVAAGPGSGKTRVLVHKLASLLLMEDVKHEQLLMLTFSRAAATEFKKRLIDLIGNAAHYVEIKTFHSYCFDLLGRKGSLEKSSAVLEEALRRIRAQEIESNRLVKAVLVIDEAQDMDAHEFELVEALIERNDELRVIAVGDDDQNIYEFRGSSSRYLRSLIEDLGAKKYELIENYRSNENIVAIANQFVRLIPDRLKSEAIVAMRKTQGKVGMVRYRSSNLVHPLVDAICQTDLSGTTCVLTTTNEDAELVTSLLRRQRLPAQLIQENHSFGLINLLEIRHFCDELRRGGDVAVISDKAWEDAMRLFEIRFRSSPYLAVCQQLLDDFASTRPRVKYWSDFDIFLAESRLEDFHVASGKTIFVSTIHKAKGREFDTVFLLLQGFSAGTPEKMRQLYVAMTRAKSNLYVHVNTAILDGFSRALLPCITVDEDFPAPTEVILSFDHKGIVLDFCGGCQQAIEQLMAGARLVLKGYTLMNAEGNAVAMLSASARQDIDSKKEKGYHVESAQVNAIVYWRKEGARQEIRIVLPILRLRREVEGGG